MPNFFRLAPIIYSQAARGILHRADLQDLQLNWEIFYFISFRFDASLDLHHVSPVSISGSYSGRLTRRWSNYNFCVFEGCQIPSFHRRLKCLFHALLILGFSNEILSIRLFHITQMILPYLCFPIFLKYACSTRPCVSKSKRWDVITFFYRADICFNLNHH